MSIDNILNSPALAGMRALNQWVVWALVPDAARPDKPKKMPFNARTGMPASSVDPATWCDVHTAAAAARAGGAHCGVGYVFAGDHWFVDIDSCLQADGTWSPLAHELCASLAGAAVEVSQSGKGLHLFGRGAVPPHASKCIEHHVEFYTEGVSRRLPGRASRATAMPT